MPHATLHPHYADLAAAHVADACVQLNIPLRCGPAGLRPLWRGTHLVGRVWPVRLERGIGAIVDAMNMATAGDVLVIDNGGRNDEVAASARRIRDDERLRALKMRTAVLDV